MYYDGIKEDHNFAGVINYPYFNRFQTDAGRLTAELMQIIFRYSISKDRTAFSINELYDEISNHIISSKQNIREEL